MHSEQMIKKINSPEYRKAIRDRDNRRIKDQIQKNIEDLAKAGKVKIKKS